MRESKARAARPEVRAPAPRWPTGIRVRSSSDPLEAAADRTAVRAIARPSRAEFSRLPLQPERVSGSAAKDEPAPTSVGHVLAGGGTALEPTLRNDMEQRFGHDFSRIRIHADGAAARSAQDIGASAYTFGHDVVFGADRFLPSTEQGRLLLAHELAHVVQQSAGPDQPRVQRKCLATELGAPAPDCTPSQQGVGGWQFRFKVGCDDLLPGEADKISKLKIGSQLKIHGFASKEGDAGFNEQLSCHRANRIADLARQLRADCPVIGTFKHGASPLSAPGVAKDLNPPDFWRSVIIEEVAPALRSGEAGLDPRSVISTTRAVYRRAKVDPTQPNLTLVFGWRAEVKDWLTSIGKTIAPQAATPDAKLTARNLDDYRQLYADAEQLWIDCDQLLATHKYPGADTDTYAAWAVGSGADQGDRLHAKGVPTGARYHVDIFGEGYFKGAINIGMAERTTTTGIQGSRVPNLIYRRFSFTKANALPIADHTADLVTSESGPIGFPGIAEEIARILAPGGTVVLYNPLSEEPAHDRVAKAVGGTVKKDKSGHTIQTTIVAPGP
jgi:hypothetical protein